MLILNKKYQAACDTLKGASRHEGAAPDEICVDLATALYGLDKPQDALKKLDQACMINPLNVTAWKNRATVKGMSSS